MGFLSNKTIMIKTNENTTTTLKTANQQLLLDSFFRTATDQKLPLAFWRKPNEDTQHLIVDFSGIVTQQSPDLENSLSGFVVAPFDNQDQTYFLHADLHIKVSNREMMESFRSQEFGSTERQHKEEFFEQWNQYIEQNQADKLQYCTSSQQQHNKEISQGQHEKLVQKGIDTIKTGAFHKVVLSRKQHVALPAGFNPVNTFLDLCEAYPTAFVSLISIPDIGTWMGASPETLVHTDNQHRFHTIALAGTQARGNYEDLMDAMWRQKEIEEQAMVSRYIINCFKKIRLREFEEIGPRTAQAGSLIHLQTDFWVDMEGVNFPDLGSVMLQLLHPTSAVCGLPMEPSFQFIKEFEGYNRELYSGYLGPVNIQDDTHLFVNLRCMQLLETEAILYAGGGITQHSNPQKEWHETAIKMQVMSQRLFRSTTPS